MKISFILTCTWAIFSIKKTQSSMAPNPFYPLRPEDLTEGEIKELQYLDEHFHRLKRSDKSGSGSGSGDILLTISRAVALGLGRKLTQVAKGSAGAVVGASGGFSKGSSSGDGKQWSYEPSDSYGPPSYGPSETTGQKIDVWDLKSSILNTLLQAVKAIKGGLLAINGQLIKGSGYVVSAKGKLISSSGDAVTRLGKNIISNAVLIKPEEKHPSSDYGPPPSYYDGPPPSSSGYAVESHYHHESIGHPDGQLHQHYEYPYDSFPTARRR
ncbi:uncharacterized protein LOC132702399 [Cylas formicarius]|uniref:uncharacterized protein LOC132702399 n=1 Tax=Cylas formicarius TaxID=197179 RepID=UPI0029587AAA|nr:uncharacterized protein LOC132702399 [Cylas formicarius]